MNRDALNDSATQMCPLTDSLASRVRWKVSDYAGFIRAELDLMLAAEEAAAEKRGSGTGSSREARR